MSHGGGVRAILAAFAANLAIAIAKFGGFLLTGSSSLLAESVHSLADTGNQGLLLLGGRRAAKQPTEAHPFGFGRERFFWAFVVSLVLFSLGGVFAVYEGISKIIHPHEVESAGIAVAILVVAVIAEGLSFRTARRESRKAGGSGSLWQFVRRTKQPELPVVLLEDAGALAGLAIALVALVLTLVTGNSIWDGIGTLCIGVLLIVIAIVLAVEMKSLLIGEAADPAVEAAVVAAIEADPDVVRLIHLRSEHLGPEELLVGVKVEFTPTLTIAELADVIDRVEASIRAAEPTVHRLYVEPDVSRPQTTPPAEAVADTLTEPPVE